MKMLKGVFILLGLLGFVIPSVAVSVLWNHLGNKTEPVSIGTMFAYWLVLLRIYREVKPRFVRANGPSGLAVEQADQPTDQ